MKMRAVTFAAAIAGVALLSCSYVHAEEEKWGEGRLWVPGGAFPEEIDDADFDSFAKVYSTMEYSHGEENFKKYCPRSIHQAIFMFDNCGTFILDGWGTAILNRYGPKPFARYGRHLIDTYGEWMMDTFGIQLINDHGDFIIKKYGKFLWDTYGDYVLMTYGHEFMKNNFESLMDKYGEYMYDNFGKELTAWNHWIELKKKAEAASKAEL